MCENSFVACGGCDEPADTLRYRESRTEYLTYAVDEDGDVTDIIDSSSDDCGDGTYECPSCGWTGPNERLDFECSPECCDCDECEPAEEEVDDGDPNEIVVLSKVGSHSAERHAMWLRDELPEELRLLLSQRTKWYIAIRRGRAAELHNLDNDYPVRVCMDTPPCAQAVADLLEREQPKEETIPLWA